MKKVYIILLGICFLAMNSFIKAENKIVVIKTNMGIMKVKIYDDVPNHTAQFTKRATDGNFDGTLFTRIINGFMIQGGAPDSKNAPQGARCGFGNKHYEIPPEASAPYFHKKGALAAPRQPVEINPEKKSDISQFFIVQGKIYTSEELDTLEMVKNNPIRKKAMTELYIPVKSELDLLKKDNPGEYRKRALAINARIDSIVSATPGHLIFTDEQRQAYTTIGGYPHLDGSYTIFGEVTEGLDVIDTIACQPKDAFDRPKKDIKILNIYVEK